MTLKNRLTRIEGHLGVPEQSILACVPESWDGDACTLAVNRLAQEAGFQGPFDSLVFPDPQLSQAELMFAGDLTELLKHIANSSRRIGMPDHGAGQ